MKDEEANQYVGFERKQAFVEHYASNPNYSGGGAVTFHAAVECDKRRFVKTPEWCYCAARHKEFWRGHWGRAIPSNFRHEGKEGWWFPEIWIDDYVESIKGRVFQPEHIQRRADQELDTEGPMLTIAEMHACPIGTQYWAEDATIHYPNGLVETWGQFRRRRRQAEAA